jgi:uncharacterized protein (TIGR02466 family)
MPVKEYFPTQIYEHDFVGETFKKIQDQITAAIPKIKSKPLSNPWSDTVKTTFAYSSKNNLLLEYGMGALMEGVVKHLNVYTTAVNYIQPVKFKNSWMNFYNNGDFQYPHHHAGSVISGIYYYQTNGRDGRVIFENPNPYLDLHLFPGSHGFTKLGIDPKPGRLVLFPSWLRHGVEINNTDHERISISFNID